MSRERETMDKDKTLNREKERDKERRRGRERERDGIASKDKDGSGIPLSLWVWPSMYAGMSLQCCALNVSEVRSIAIVSLPFLLIAFVTSLRLLPLL